VVLDLKVFREKRVKLAQLVPKVVRERLELKVLMENPQT
jgi:hypothetical protein